MESDPCSSRPQLIYQPWVQPTNRPPFPHAPNMPKPQPPIHSFPLTRNSGTHKQVSPSYSPLPMVAKFQLVHRICSYCERLLRQQFSAHGAWSLSFQICHLQRWIDMRKQKPELEGRFLLIIGLSFVLQPSLPFVLSSHISCSFPPKNAFPGHDVRSVQVHRWPTTLFSALLPLFLYCWKGKENEGESESDFVLIWRASCVLCLSPQGTNNSIIIYIKLGCNCLQTLY